MSSRSRKSRRPPSSSSSSYFPTEWSDWEPSPDYPESTFERRYRLKREGEYEYDVRPVERLEVPRTGQVPLDGVPDSNGPYTTLASYTASVSEVTASFAQASLGPARITTRNPSTDREEFDPHFKVHQSWEFKRGRVFKVLWAEPGGNGGDEGRDGNSDPGTMTERSGQYGERLFQKVRRFVIIKAMHGHCICLPINTYTRKGVMKPGVQAHHHTIAYCDKKPVYFKGEKAKGLTKRPIKIVPSSPRHKLADTSRLNYAKTYTVEHNVKVWFIGKVDKESEWQLVTDFNSVNPPLEAPGRPPLDDDTFNYAEGGGAEISSSPPSNYGFQTNSGRRPRTPSYSSGSARDPNYSSPLSSSAWSPNDPTPHLPYIVTGESSVNYDPPRGGDLHAYPAAPRRDEYSQFDTVEEEPEDLANDEDFGRAGPHSHSGSAPQNLEYDEIAYQAESYGPSETPHLPTHSDEEENDHDARYAGAEARSAGGEATPHHHHESDEENIYDA